jgi:hypothetical protein
MTCLCSSLAGRTFAMEEPLESPSVSKTRKCTPNGTPGCSWTHASEHAAPASSEGGGVSSEWGWILLVSSSLQQTAEEVTRTLVTVGSACRA